MSKPLCAICGEPMAAVVEVRRTNRPWQRYDVYSALAVAEDTKRRVEGDGIEARVIPLYQHTAPQAVPQAWLPSSNPPTEAQGEVLVLMQDGTCEIAWATYWHGSSNAFARWMFRDPDMEDATPTHWMPLPAAPKGAV